MIKNMFSIGRALTAVLVAATLLTACEYKDLEDNGGGSAKKTKFALLFDWEKVDSIPQSMRVVFYPKNLSQYAQGYTVFDVVNRDTVIELPAGTYDVTAWNNDTEHVITSTYAKKEAAYATTGNYSPHGDVNVPKVLDSLYHSQRVLDYPDYMVHANKKLFELTDKDNVHSLVLDPDSMVVTVEVRLHGIAGLEWCHNIRGAVNNIAGKRFMAYDNQTADTVTVMFDAQAHEADSTVTAKFWVFGIEPSDLSYLSHRMVFFFWVTGNQVYVPLDVTKAFARATKNDTYLLIESQDLGIDLKDYVRQGGTGWTVQTEDWNNTEEIPINF